MSVSTNCSAEQCEPKHGLIVALVGTVSYFGAAETLDWQAAGGIIGGLCGFWLAFSIAVYACRSVTQKYENRWSAQTESSSKIFSIRASNPYSTDA